MVDKNGQIINHILGPRDVYVLIECFGGKLILQEKAEGMENSGKLGPSTSKLVKPDWHPKTVALTSMAEELGLFIPSASSDDVEFQAAIDPCEETDGKLIYLYTYLLDIDTEKIRPNLKKVKRLIIGPLPEILEDIKENKDLYLPSLILCLDRWLSGSSIRRVSKCCHI